MPPMGNPDVVLLGRHGGNGPLQCIDIEEDQARLSPTYDPYGIPAAPYIDQKGNVASISLALALRPCKPTTWSINCSRRAQRTSNPIRNITDSLRPVDNHQSNKSLLTLSLGDPTSFLAPPAVLIEALAANLHAGLNNGYDMSIGNIKAREALAHHYSVDSLGLTADDVIIASGGSGALEIAISALLNEGDTLLVPNPGFPLYKVIAKSIGATVQSYNLMPDQNWEIDLVHLESLITTSTKCVLINNPSNPTGSVLSEANLLGLLEIAERHKLPIISDEMYSKITFSGAHFYQLAFLSASVPVLTIGGLAKQFCVPGWRVGWILIYDRQGIFSAGGDASLRKGLRNLTQIIIGANTLAVSTIPLLFPPPSHPSHASLAAYRQHYISALEANALLLTTFLRLHSCALSSHQPQGAMFSMIRLHLDLLHDIDDDVEFSQKLLQEENVLVLPGQCFGISGFVRLCLAVPAKVLQESLQRIQEFCLRRVRCQGQMLVQDVQGMEVCAKLE